MTDPQRLIEARKYLRHSMDAPLSCAVRSEGVETTAGLVDISDGGASISSKAKYRKGQSIELRFPVFKDCSVVPGTIAWDRTDKDSPENHRYGIKFKDDTDKAMLRMVEMICHIMTFRAMQEHLTGKSIPADDAAREWLSKYADTFPE